MTIEDIKRRNVDAGRHWFEPDTMRFFGTRVHDEVYGGRFFVTSEKDPDGLAWDGQRRYSVREALPDGSIVTASEFGEFDTAKEARAYAVRRAAEADS